MEQASVIMPFRRGAVPGSRRRKLLTVLLALPVTSRTLAGRAVRRSLWHSCGPRVFVGRGGVARRPRAGAAAVAVMRSSESKLEEMELWLDEIGVDRHDGKVGTPTAKLRRFQGRGIGLEANVELERDSTVRNEETRVEIATHTTNLPTVVPKSVCHTMLVSFQFLRQHSYDVSLAGAKT